MVLVSNDDGGRTLLGFILAFAVMSPQFVWSEPGVHSGQNCCKRRLI